MDYLAFDPATHSLWVPAGNRGAVYVLDTRTRAFREVPGFATRDSGRYVSGPSSATVGDGFVYVGNRADGSVCPVDAKTLQRGACVTVSPNPDGLAYVAATREVWSTTPKNQTLTILGTGAGGALHLAGTVQLPGDPEGYAVDDRRGIFYTNLEDKDRTLAIDVKTRKVVATMDPACGGRGPRGLVIDVHARRLFVGCSDGAVVLDLAHAGAVVGQIKTGDGVDNIGWSARDNRVLIASGRTATLVEAAVSPAGALTLARTEPTSDGVRCVVVDDSGAPFLADGKAGRLWVRGPARRP